METSEIIVLGEWAFKKAMCERLASGSISHVGLNSPSVSAQGHSPSIDLDGDDDEDFEEHMINQLSGQRGLTFYSLRKQEDLSYLKVSVCANASCIVLCFPVVGRRARRSFQHVRDEMIDSVQNLYIARASRTPSLRSRRTKQQASFSAPPIILCGTYSNDLGPASLRMISEDEIQTLVEERQLFGSAVVDVTQASLWRPDEDDEGGWKFGKSLLNEIQRANRLKLERRGQSGPGEEDGQRERMSARQRRAAIRRPSIGPKTGAGMVLWGSVDDEEEEEEEEEGEEMTEDSEEDDELLSLCVRTDRMSLVSQRNEPVIQILNHPEPDEEVFPLHFSALRGEARTLCDFVRDGMDLNVADQNGRRAIHWAVIGNQYLIVRRLLQRSDVEADQVDHQGLTPLGMAAILGHVICIRMLLSSGRAKSDRLIGVPPRFKAAALSNTTETTNVFFEHCQLQEQLAHAVQMGDLSHLESVVANASLNFEVTMNEKTVTPLDVAISKPNNLPMVQFLLRNQAGVLDRHFGVNEEYDEVLGRAKRMFSREQRVREFVQTESSYWEDLTLLVEHVTKKCLKHLHEVIPEQDNRDRIATVFSSAFKIQRAHKLIRSMLRRALPRMTVWKPIDLSSPASSSLLTPSISLRDAPLIIDDVVPTTWFDVSRVFDAMSHFPVKEYESYMVGATFLLTLLQDERYGGMKSLMEECGREFPPWKVSTLSSILFIPSRRITKMRDLCVRIMDKTDASEEAILEKLEPFVAKLHALGDRLDQLTGMVTSSQQERRDFVRIDRLFETTYHKKRTAVVPDERLVCFRIGELRFSDLQDSIPEGGAERPGILEAIFGRDIPRSGPLDIFVFSRSIVFGVAKRLQRYSTEKTKVVWTWNAKRFQITVYELGDPPAFEAPRILLDRVVFCPTEYIPQTWYEKLVEHSNSSILESSHYELNSGVPWLHLSHSIDAARVTNFLWDAREDREVYIANQKKFLVHEFGRLESERGGIESEIDRLQNILNQMRALQHQQQQEEEEEEGEGETVS